MHEVGNAKPPRRAWLSSTPSRQSSLLPTLRAHIAEHPGVQSRTYLDVRRARADLEALIETSPVAVLVFDTKSGCPVSFNREARRMAESLRMQGRLHEQLLEVMSFRCSDSSEVDPAALSGSTDRPLA